MNRIRAYQILKISENASETEIRDAYRRLLPENNPEDNPEGFMQLRQAYDTAMQYLYELEEEEDDIEDELSEIDIFMMNVEKIYDDIRLRSNIEKWKELFKDDLCTGLDTSDDVENRLLSFLMTHTCLPHEVWLCINKVFDITDDMDNLGRIFPKDFLDYVKYKIENDSYFPYELMSYTVKDIKVAQADTYIRKMGEIKHRIDNIISQIYEKENADTVLYDELRECRNELKELAGFGVYHPFSDVEIIRISKCLNDIPALLECCEKLSEYADKSDYIASHLADALWKAEEYEKTFEISKKICENIPDNVTAKYFSAKYYKQNEQYYEARKELEELLTLIDQNDDVIALFREVNTKLIEQYLYKIENNIEDEHFPGYELVIETGWMLYQNDRIEEAIKLLEKYEIPGEEYRYSYTNLFGRVLYKRTAYKKALPYLRRWRKMVWETEDDGTQESRKRLERKCMSCAILGANYFKLGDRENAIECLETAIKEANNLGEVLNCMNQLSSMYLEWEEYDRVIQICDEMIKKYDKYSPAYCLRLLATCRLNNEEEILHDYNILNEISLNNTNVYKLITDYFINNKKYDKAQAVMAQAEANQIDFTPKMMLQKIKVLRVLNVIEYKYQTEKLLNEIEIRQANKSITEGKGWDIEDDDEIIYEKAYWCIKSGNSTKAENYLQVLLENNKNSKYETKYQMLLAYAYIESSAFQQAKKLYDICAEEWENTPELNYGYARCYEASNDLENAEKCYRKVLSYDDNYLDTYIRLSKIYDRIYNNTNDVKYRKTALEYISTHIEKNPYKYHGYYIRGSMYFEEYELDLAIEDFKKVKEYSNWWVAWARLGYCYELLGQYDRAIENLDKAIELFSARKEDKWVYFLKAKCYEKTGRYDQAIEVYKLLQTQIDPDDKMINFFIAMDFERMGQDKEALKYYKKTGNRYCERLPYIWLRKGRVYTAVEYFNNMFVEDKSVYLVKAGLIYVDYLGKPRRGLKYLLKALSLARTYEEKFEASKQIARAYYYMKKPKLAGYYAKGAYRFLKKLGEDKQKLPKRTGDIAWLELCIGNKEKALKLLQDMDKHIICRECRCEKCYEQTLFLGDIYAAAGDINKAIEMYEEAIKRNILCDEAKWKLKRLRRKM